VQQNNHRNTLINSNGSAVLVAVSGHSAAGRVSPVSDILMAVGHQMAVGHFGSTVLFWNTVCKITVMHI